MNLGCGAGYIERGLYEKGVKDGEKYRGGVMWRSACGMGIYGGLFVLCCRVL